MSEEDAFLRKLLEQPNNDLTRLVYADWLDEQQTPVSLAKAEFLRLIADVELAGRFPDRVQALARKLDLQWLATLSKLPIENCEHAGDTNEELTELGFRMSYACPKRWEELGILDGGSEERYCEECHQTIYYCHTARELELHVSRWHCVAVDLSVLRKPGDATNPRPRPRVGLIIADPPLREQLEPPRRSWWSRLWRGG